MPYKLSPSIGSVIGLDFWFFFLFSTFEMRLQKLNQITYTTIKSSSFISNTQLFSFSINYVIFIWIYKDDFSDFSDDDDDDELEESNTYIKSNQSFLNGSNSIIQPLNALDSLIITPENKPKLHNLDSILSTLQGIRISFDNYTTPQGNIIYRRELFDVKHQLMIEEEQEEEEEEGNNIGVHKLLIDENQNNNDLQKMYMKEDLKVGNVHMIPLMH